MTPKPNFWALFSDFSDFFSYFPGETVAHIFPMFSLFRPETYFLAGGHDSNFKIMWNPLPFVTPSLRNSLTPRGAFMTASICHLMWMKTISTTHTFECRRKTTRTPNSRGHERDKLKGQTETNSQFFSQIFADFSQMFALFLGITACRRRSLSQKTADFRSNPMCLI